MKLRCLQASDSVAFISKACQRYSHHTEHACPEELPISSSTHSLEIQATELLKIELVAIERCRGSYYCFTCCAFGMCHLLLIQMSDIMLDTME